MEIRDVEICRHRAVDDHGNQYAIVVKQKTKFALSKGILHEAPMHMVYVLDNGENVNPLEEGVFKIVESGTIIRKIG